MISDMTSPTQTIVVYSFILDTISVVVFIYTPPLKRCMNGRSTQGPTILFFKDNITTDDYFLRKGII
jgi:hypothetical protein